MGNVLDLETPPAGMAALARAPVAGASARGMSDLLRIPGAGLPGAAARSWGLPLIREGAATHG